MTGGASVIMIEAPPRLGVKTMDKIRHKALRDTVLIVSDTPRKVDSEGYVCDLTEFEFAKCAGIPYCFEVVSDAVEEDEQSATEDEEPKESDDAVKSEKPTPVKRGRPAGKR